MYVLRRLRHILHYGSGEEGRARKRAAKDALRRKWFLSDRWHREGALARRVYATYEDYLAHQAAKLEHIRESLQGAEPEELAEFRRRFAGCTALRGSKNVVCLGARLGTEVRALREMGLFALGIDLNPGERNEYVLHGDFHRLRFADGSVDAVYTNALDHAFDLEALLREIARILGPGGVLVVDATSGYEEGFTPGDYASASWPTLKCLVDQVCARGRFEVEEVRDLGGVDRDRCFQAVFRKPASTRTPGEARSDGATPGARLRRPPRC